MAATRPPDRPDLARLAEPALSQTFGALFGTHAAGLRRYLARRAGGAAEDLVAETFLVALRERGTYDPARAGVRAWLYGIASNLLRHHVRTEVRALRATARLAAHGGVGEPHHDRVAARVDAASRVRRLAGALAELPPGDRDVLLLTSWAGLSATEVGEALGIPAGTVRSRLHRTRRALRRVDAAADTNVGDDDNA